MCGCSSGTHAHSLITATDQIERQVCRHTACVPALCFGMRFGQGEHGPGIKPHLHLRGCCCMEADGLFCPPRGTSDPFLLWFCLIGTLTKTRTREQRTNSSRSARLTR